MRGLFETLENWAAGVVTSIASHTLPPEASPRAWNTILEAAGLGQAVFAKREGLRTMNSTPITNSPAILAEIDYKRQAAGALTAYHLIVSDNGRADKLNGDGTTSPADAVTPAPFTTGTNRPDWATVRNFLYLVNGVNQKKFDGTTWFNFSQARPAAAPTVTDSGVGGTPVAGTYEGVIAYYNTNTGQYSSRSDPDPVTTAGANQIDFAWSAPPDAQTTHVVVGIRKTDIQTQFFEITKIAIGTTTYRFNGDVTLLTVPMPEVDSHNPPPTDTRALESHKDRVFVTDGKDLYFTEKHKPEAFDPDNKEPVNREDGKLKVALHSAHDVLLILTRQSSYYLAGDDPAEWRVEVLDPEIGTISPRTIFTVDGITYWWSERGLVAWAGPGSKVTLISSTLIAPTVDSAAVNYAALEGAMGAPSTLDKLLIFALPETGQTRNTFMVAYNYEERVWVTDRWDPMDVSSLSVVDENLAPRVFLGGYKGQLFKLLDTGNDGVPAGTKTGSVTAATASTLTDSTAAFHTTGGKLIERYVYALDPARIRVQRRRITDNTSTQLTIASDWSTTPGGSGSGWTYIIGGPDFQLDTRWNFAGVPFLKKRFQHFFLFAASTNSNVSLDIDLFLDFNATTPTKRLTALISGAGAKWGPSSAGSKWGQAKWVGGAKLKPVRKRVAKTGVGWRARIMNRQPDQAVQVFMVSMSSEALSTKLS